MGRAWNVREQPQRLAWLQWREHVGAMVCGALRSQESDQKELGGWGCGKPVVSSRGVTSSDILGLLGEGEADGGSGWEPGGRVGDSCRCPGKK